MTGRCTAIGVERGETGCPGSIDTEMIQTLFRSANDAEALREAVWATWCRGGAAEALGATDGITRVARREFAAAM